MDGLLRHFAAAFRNEQPILWLDLHPVCPQRFQRFFRKKGIPVAAALTLTDEYATFPAVYVAHLEVCGFTDPQAGAVDGHEQRFVSKTVARQIEEEAKLLFRWKYRQAASVSDVRDSLGVERTVQRYAINETKRAVVGIDGAGLEFLFCQQVVLVSKDLCFPHLICRFPVVILKKPDLFRIIFHRRLASPPGFKIEFQLFQNLLFCHGFALLYNFCRQLPLQHCTGAYEKEEPAVLADPSVFRLSSFIKSIVNYRAAVSFFLF